VTTQLQSGREAPWKQRFRAPAIVYSAIAAHAPARGIAVLNKEGPYQVYAWNVPSGELERRTDRSEGLIGAALSPDGRTIYYLNDQLGNEVGHFVRIPHGGGETEDITPGLPPYNPAFPFITPLGLAISRNGARLAFTAGTDDGFRIYTMDVAASGAGCEPREIYHCERLISAPILSSGGELVVVSSTERYKRPQYSLLAFDAASGERVGELWEGEEFSVTHLFTSPLPGDLRVAALTNRSGVERLVLWNPATGERTDPALTSIQGAMNAFDWSGDGRTILFRTFNQAVQQLYVYDVAKESAYKLNHPSGTNFSPYFGPDGDVYSHLATAAEPTRLVRLDLHTGAVKQTLIEAGDVVPGRPWQSITFSSSDGQPIQGWLAVPDGHGPFPLILHTHGGPQAVQAVEFQPEAQAWLDHGFAWASINYRGSTTFGKTFEEQIWGNAGDLEVEDMVAARAYLVDEGVAAPDQVFLTGWSYGGYLTLQALGKYPELWAGGMAGIAIADWAMTYEDSAESLKKYCQVFFEGTPQEKPEQYARSSPITYADRVRAPILIIQGRNDLRTPARPIEVYETRLRALGKRIEVHWFDAGHMGSFAQVEQAIEHQEKMLRFALGILG
jgi:dienelactone hydrolase